MQERPMSPALSLAILVVMTIGVGIGGYLLFEHYLLHTFNNIWNVVTEYWTTFSLAALWRGAIAWFMRQGLRWLLIEIPKKFFLYYILPYAVIYLLPREWVRRKRQQLRAIKNTLFAFKDWFMGKLRFYLGDYAGVALALVFLIGFFVLFYSLFSVYVVLWFGFIKFPAFMVYAWNAVGHFLGQVAQRIGFKAWAFRVTKVLTDRIWIPLLKYLPWVKHNPLSKEEKEKRQYETALQRTKWAIKKRIAKEKHLMLLRKVGWNVAEYRRIRRKELHQEHQAKEAREIPVVHRHHDEAKAAE